MTTMAVEVVMTTEEETMAEAETKTSERSGTTGVTTAVLECQIDCMADG